MQWVIFAILGAAAVFLIAPSALTFFMTFYGRYSPEAAMKKVYFPPYRKEMDEAINWFSTLTPQKVSITARDGVRLAGKYYDRGTGRTAILFHGYNATALSNFCVSGKALWERGFGLLMIDQRAHGESGGHKTGFGLLERYDLLDWIDWAEQNTDSDKMIVYGVSMGCSALAFASDKIKTDKVKAMVLDCGFTSPYSQMLVISKKHHAPGKLMIPLIRLLAKLFLGEDLRDCVTESLKKTKIPAYFLHGEADKIVPVSEGRAGYAACASPKDASFVPEAEHTMSFIKGGEKVQKSLFDFIDTYC